VNFELLRSEINVQPALDEINKYNLWNWLNLRRAFPLSSHREAEDVVLRFAPIDRPQDYNTFMNGLDTVHMWPWFSHATVRFCIGEALNGVLDMNSVLGRVMATRLSPGKQIYLHADEGAYAHAHDRYHIVLQAELDTCKFYCGDDMVMMTTGQLWKFNHELPHRVVNDGDTDRVNLIVDVRR
jgi:hypothetical protein